MSARPSHRHIVWIGYIGSIGSGWLSLNLDFGFNFNFLSTGFARGLIDSRSVPHHVVHILEVFDMECYIFRCGWTPNTHNLNRFRIIAALAEP